MNLAFINCTADTFTPTKSGAIGTWIWEVCCAAERDGVRPLVLSRRTDADPYPWEPAVFIDYPHPPSVRGLGRLAIWQQKLLGWGHVRQHIYVSRVADAIRRGGLGDATLFLQNDIELAVYLRGQFPQSRIIHHAQNNNPCSSRFRKNFAGSVDLTTAVTNFCADWNANYYGRPVRTLYSGVDADRFSPRADADASARPVINFVGRVDPPKGPDILLRAALLLSQRTHDFSLQILGSNYYDRYHFDDFQEYLQKLTAQLEQAGIEVRRPGWVTRADLPGELRRAHIHCVPARWDEPFGLTALEGMACGLATVAARTGGTPEVVADAGILFEREAVEQLAGQLERLVCDASLRSDYARRARERALAMSWDQTWSAVRKLLEP